MSIISKIIISHYPCSDGFLGKYLFYKNFPEAEYVSGIYGRSAPNVKGKDVFIVDFSYPREILEKMVEDCNSLVLLDHHKSAQKDLEGFSNPKANIIFDMNKSGAMLAWDYLFATEPHWLVKYVQDSDLWRWQLPNAKEICAAIYSYPFEVEDWDELFTRTPEDLISEGKSLLREKKKSVDQAVKQAREVTILGSKVLAVNATSYISELGSQLCENMPFAVVYYDNKNDRKYSFRSSDKGLDVSEIAKQFGGGGHVRSAACTTPLNKYIWDNYDK